MKKKILNNKENKMKIDEIKINIDSKKKPFKIISIKEEKLTKNKISYKQKTKKKINIIKRFLAFEKLKYKNIYKRKFLILARMLKKAYNKKLKELQEKIYFVNQCKQFFEEATEATLNHKKEFMAKLEQYEIDSIKLVEFFRMFERNKLEIENIAKNISKVEFKTMLDWNRKFKNKFDKLIK